MFAVADAFRQLQDENARLRAQLVSDRARQQSEIDSLNAQIEDLRSRWIGSPPLWQPSTLPPNTEMRYYPVTGTTQRELLQSMIAFDLCGHYACLPDPGQPPGVTFALEGDITPPGQYCYSPRTLTFTFRHFILLPLWAAPQDGSTKILVVQRWNALLDVLFTHEAKHVAIAEADFASLNDQAHQQPSCAAAIAFWQDPHVLDQLHTDQNVYHAQLRAGCRPEIGCVPPGWMGW